MVDRGYQNIKRLLLRLCLTMKTESQLPFLKYISCTFYIVDFCFWNFEFLNSFIIFIISMVFFKNLFFVKITDLIKLTNI